MKKRTKRTLQTALAVSALTAAAGTLSIVQVRRREHGWGRGTHYGRRFNPADLTELKGTVQSITRFRPDTRMSEGVEVLLESDHGAIPVHLGPTRWLREFAETLAPGDAIEVFGSRVVDGDTRYMIATAVRKDGETVELRTPEGKPLWHHAAQVAGVGPA